MRTLLIIVSVILLFNFCGCVSTLQSVYYPNANNVPMLQEKGNIKATIEYTNAQIAFAVSHHVGIMVNGQYNNLWFENEADSVNLNAPPYDSPNEVDYSTKLLEGGIGYFDHITDDITWEVYGGYGQGQLTTLENNHIPYNLNFNKGFIQPAIGWIYDNREIILSCRTSYLNFYEFKHPTLDASFFIPKMYNNVVNFRPNLFDALLLEPAFTLRVGFKDVKLNFQLGCSFQIINNGGINQSVNNNYTLDYFLLNANVGIAINIDEWMYEKPSSPKTKLQQ